MKTGFFLPLLFSIFITSPVYLQAGNHPASIEYLKQEIAGMLKNRNLSFLESEIQSVSVDFLINARNELVILDVFGDSLSACEYVKEVLNYKRVKFQQAKQLTRYMIRIKLIRNLK